MILMGRENGKVFAATSATGVLPDAPVCEWVREDGDAEGPLLTAGGQRPAAASLVPVPAALLRDLRRTRSRLSVRFKSRDGRCRLNHLPEPWRHATGMMSVEAHQGARNHYQCPRVTSDQLQ